MRIGKKLPYLAVSLMLAGGAAACGGEEAQQTPEATPAEQAPGTTGGDPMGQPGATQPAPGTATTPPAGGGQTAGGASSAMVQQGQQVYASSACVACHGPDASGTTLAPNLRDNQWIWIDPGQPDVHTQMVTLIKTGVSQPKEYPAPMPPMGGAQLSDEQLDAVAAYILSVSQGG